MLRTYMSIRRAGMVDAYDSAKLQSLAVVRTWGAIPFRIKRGQECVGDGWRLPLVVASAGRILQIAESRIDGEIWIRCDARGASVSATPDIGNVTELFLRLEGMALRTDAGKLTALKMPLRLLPIILRVLAHPDAAARVQGVELSGARARPSQISPIAEIRR